MFVGAMTEGLAVMEVWSGDGRAVDAWAEGFVGMEVWRCVCVGVTSNTSTRREPLKFR